MADRALQADNPTKRVRVCARLHIEKGTDFPYLNIMRLQIVFFSIIAIALGLVSDQLTRLRRGYSAARIDITAMCPKTEQENPILGTLAESENFGATNKMLIGSSL